MRCARSDQSTCTITLHYLSNGTLRLRLSIRKRELMIPLALILRALQPDLSDCNTFVHMKQGADVSSCSKTSPQIVGILRCLLISPSVLFTNILNIFKHIQT